MRIGPFVTVVLFWRSVTGDEEQTTYVLDRGILPAVVHLMDSRKKSIRKEACWTISVSEACVAGE
jgi:hypothetical protein